MIAWWLACTPEPVAPEAPAPVAAPVEVVAPADVGLARTEPAVTGSGSVITMAPLPSYTPALADGDGKDLVAAHCGACHATTYIGMQPPLPRDKWDATVKKMVDVHGANIPDDVRPALVDYLAAAYGPR